MADRTSRGEEERKRDDDVMVGEPVPAGTPNAPSTPVTRDKSVAPATDQRRDGRGAEERRANQ